MFIDNKVYCHLASSRRCPVLPRFRQMAGMLDLCTERKFFTRPPTGVESTSGNSVCPFICLSSLLILFLQTLSSRNLPPSTMTSPFFSFLLGVELCVNLTFFLLEIVILVSFIDLFLWDLFIISLGAFPLGPTKIKLYATFYRDSSSMSKYHQS